MRPDGSPTQSIVGILAVILVGVGIFKSAMLLQSGRPAVPARHETTEHRPEGARARLWQDPLEVVYEHAALHHPEKKSGSKSADAGPLLRALRWMGGSRSADAGPLMSALRWIGGSKSLADDSPTDDPLSPENQLRAYGGKREDHCLLLPVLLDGGPYAEDRETRLRMRYAVLSALNVAGYKPAEWERLHFMRLEVSAPVESPTPDEREIDVPFELFDPDPFTSRERREQTPPRVLVLWIDEALIREAPIHFLREILEEVGMVAKPKGRRPTLRIIGPTSSPMLIAMLRENEKVWEGLAACGDDEDDARFLYCCRATIHRELLYSGDHYNVKKELGERYTRWVIKDDLALAGLLVDELAARGVSWSVESDRVVLVSEWDTDYGRAFLGTFRQAVGSFCEDRGETLNTMISGHGFMRGIDGYVPGAREKSSAPAERSAGQREDRGGESQPPHGRSRFDYLERLALHVKETSGEPRAIGVFGSDVYDKLLILHALRPLFPQAIFFTTDLDARLLHPAELRSTRNLLVASHFGLRLRPELQKGMPPFRDTYQTATFLGVMVALGVDVHSREPEKAMPRIYEIGTDGAYDLTPIPRKATKDPNPKRRSLRMSRSAGDVAVIFFVVVSAVLLVIPLIPILRRRKGATGGGIPGPIAHNIITVLAYAVILALVAAIWHVSKDNAEEPFTWFAGISVWPTNILRLLAAVIAVSALSVGYGKLWRNQQSIDERFFGGGESGPTEPLPSGGSDPVGRTSLRTWLRSLWARAVGFWVLSWGATPEGSRRAQDAWSLYLHQSRPRSRLVRVLPLIAIYIGLGYSLMQLTGRPVSPVRGECSTTLDLVITRLSVVAMIVLIIVAFDATCLCARLVRMLATREPLDWAGATLQKIGRGREPSQFECGELARIDLLARHTRVVTTLLYAPLLVLLLMILSRSRVFDNWRWPVGLVLVIALGLSVVIGCAIILRRAAERIRRETIARIRARLATVVTTVVANGFAMDRMNAFTESLRMTRGEIEDERRGAFGSYLRSPVVRALMIPFSGVGTLAILDLFL